jgi:hypothetical protein
MPSKKDSVKLKARVATPPEPKGGTKVPPEIRALLCSELELMVRRLSELAKCEEEALVEEIRQFYRNHPRWRTKPDANEKKRSFIYHGRACFNCGQPIGTLREAIFHHHRRGVRDQHKPENMVPCHQQGKCYESVRSMTKNTRKR